MKKNLIILFLLFILLGIIIGVLLSSCNDESLTNNKPQFKELISNKTVGVIVDDLTLVTLDIIFDMSAPVHSSANRLPGLKKTYLKAKQNRSIEFKHPKRKFAFVNNDLELISQNGAFNVTITNMSTDFIYQ